MSLADEFEQITSKGPKKPRPKEQGKGSKTSTGTSTKTSTKTSTVAHTQGNVTVTGGAGDGNTIVHIKKNPQGAAA